MEYSIGILFTLFMVYCFPDNLLSSDNIFSSASARPLRYSSKETLNRDNGDRSARNEAPSNRHLTCDILIDSRTGCDSRSCCNNVNIECRSLSHRPAEYTPSRASKGLNWIMMRKVQTLG